ncbi:MAG: hypothetical protein ACXVUX_17900 [Solirubrobacteraceae bacterium]
MAAEAHDTTTPLGVDVVGALRRYWPAVVLCVVLLVGAAVALGLRRPAKYTSTATLQVGHVYISNPAGVSTIIESTQTLAGVYSRTIHATSVQQDVARRLKRASVRVSGALSATPLPSSPLIKVTAEATTAAGATALANAGANALQAYVNHEVRATDVTASLSKRYEQAALNWRHMKDTSDRLARRYRLNPSTRNRNARDDAAAATDSAELAAEALKSSYQQAVAGGTASAVIENFARAGLATSDRKATMQVLVFVGLLGGIAAGAALALLGAYRATRPSRPR